MTTYEIRHGDCLDVLRTLEPASIDAVVTDPPYGLSFMGKKWDYDVPTVDVWAECLRVLKPGGHLLAFAGTRTQHRMAVRIEDAGFEIRDMIAWVYGSGFPKSLDVSKAIDASDAAEEQARRRYRFTEWVRSHGVTPKQINAALGGGDMGRHYTDVPPSGNQPAIMTREHLEACRHLFAEVPEWVERECDVRSVESQNMKARKVLGSRSLPDTTKVRAGFVGEVHSGNAHGSVRDVAYTAPHTQDAAAWSGWGTALKPALEPITVARKPLIGTVAANVLAHGTGAINVDGCRVQTDDSIEIRENRSMRGGNFGASSRAGEPSAERRYTQNGSSDFAALPGVRGGDPAGRWPANLIHDGSEECTGLLGEAARFFYCPKTSKADREDGCGALPIVAHQSGMGGAMPVDDEGDARDRFKASSRNHHPTVKPTDLMRYLCRLVTPPGGLVLDPFTGSGSTGRGAVLEGFRFLGIEREAEYVEIARRRIAAASSVTVERDLFS